MFYQKIKDGNQIEFPDYWLIHGNPWEIERMDVSACLCARAFACVFVWTCVRVVFLFVFICAYVFDNSLVHRTPWEIELMA